MRDRIARIFSARATFIAVAVLTAALTAFGAIGFLVGLPIALITVWARHWDWAWLGIARPSWKHDFGRALKYTVLTLIVVDILLQPLLNRLTGTTIDVSQLEFIRGNPGHLLWFTIYMWLIAACGEEIFFRGYLMRGWARLAGDGRAAWLLGGVLSTLPFGLVHLYQGWSGVLNTAAVGALLATQLYRGKDRLASCILTHGLYDMVGLTLLYFDRADLLERLLF